jgi:hypothetical protein
VTNSLLALVAGACLLGVGVLADATAVGAGFAVLSVLLSLAMIYFRGYLVPGTPELTKRYFPPWLLAVFGKADRSPSVRGDGEADSAEATLTRFGALEPSDDGRDDRFTEGFAAEWADALDRTDGVGADELARALDADVDVETWGDAVRVYATDRLVGKWDSEAAFRADLASASALSAHADEWAELSGVDRARALDRLRTAVERCPSCGGAVEHGTETVEGCCATHESTTVACAECGARLYIETCPDCGSRTEYHSASVEFDDRTVEVPSRSCTDCEDTRVFALPPSFADAARTRTDERPS